MERPPRLVAAPRAGLGRLRKIGFLGSHEASLNEAPWDDPSWEFWAHASAKWLYKKEPDRYFDLHRKECWTKTNAKGAAYTHWLARNPVPIYMQAKFPEVPASIRYPIDQVSFGMARRYFTGHVAYMIGLALMEGVTHLGFFGVNYSPDCEYGTQRGSAEYWMGRAEGVGVHLVIPPSCTLLADPHRLYGYDSHDADGVLVEAYRKRVWTTRRPIETALGPDGLEQIPAYLQAQVETDALQVPPEQVRQVQAHLQAVAAVQRITVER